MLWLGANTWLFLKTFLLYSTGQQYHYLYKMLGVRPVAYILNTAFNYFSFCVSTFNSHKFSVKCRSSNL